MLKNVNKYQFFIRYFSNQLNICKLGVNHKHNRVGAG